jgi:aminoglycoside/choline kinase family phosphotransferase
VSDSKVPEAVVGFLDRQGIDAARIVPLTGDASDRKYFRVIPRTAHSLVVALHAQPFEPGSLPFVHVTRLFEAVPVPVPRLLGEAPDLGILALEDLGDVTLQAHLGAASPGEIEALYTEAVDHVIVLQRRGRDLEDPRALPYTLAFDVEKLTWEMNFFIKHFLVAYRGLDLDAATRGALTEELDTLVRELAGEPRVLCHRDYHSRNLMVTPRGLVVIDFQDARLGPDTYDLVSLLRDSYVDLPDQLQDRLIERFRAGSDRHESRPAFDARFGAMAMQRNLKALGTFGYQATARANPVYAQYVPRTLRYVRQTLSRFDRFARLADVLGGLVPEVRI